MNDDQDGCVQIIRQALEHLLERLNSTGGRADHHQIAMSHKETSPREMFRNTVEISAPHHGSGAICRHSQ